jgi:hypothetical protein
MTAVGLLVFAPAAPVDWHHRPAPATNPSCPRPRRPGVRPWWRLEEQTREQRPAASTQRPGAALNPDQGATPPSTAEARSPGRRAFLVGSGGLAAAALMGPGGRWSGSEQVTSGSASSTQPSGSGSALDLEARRARALQLRLTTAHQQLRDRFPQPAPTATRTATQTTLSGLATFTKALPHNTLGEVDPGADRALLRACAAAAPRTSRGSRWGQGQAGQPEGAFSFELQGLTPGSGPGRPGPEQRGLRRRDDRVLLAGPGPRHPPRPLRPRAGHRRRHRRPAPLRRPPTPGHPHPAPRQPP